MATTEEKLLTLLVSAEHLKETAKEQQEAVADSLAVARETLKGYREISDSVAQQVRDEVRQEVQKMDVAGLIGERISADFQRLEKSVGNMKINADALDKEISIIRSNIIAEYNTLRGYSWKWFAGVAVAFVVLIFATSWFVKTELQDNYNASAAVYQKVADLEKLLTTEQKPEKKKN